MTDGTEAGTQLVRNFLDGLERSLAHVMGTVEGRAIIMTKNQRVGSALWISDGTLDGTFRIHQNPIAIDYRDLNFNFVTLPDGRALFDYSVPEFGRELWISDGTAAGTQLFSDINPGSSPGAARVSLNATKVFAVALSDQHGDAEVFGVDYAEYQAAQLDPAFYAEEERPGLAFGEIRASDPLLGEPVAYRVHDATQATIFLIEKSGLLRLQPSVSLDYETLAANGETSGTILVDVDYRDLLTDDVITRQLTVRYEVVDRIEPPRIDDQSVTVDENLERGTFLMSLVADVFPASQVRFTRVGGSPFEVDQASGRVYAAEASVMDFETGLCALSESESLIR